MAGTRGRDPGERGELKKQWCGFKSREQELLVGPPTSVEGLQAPDAGPVGLVTSGNIPGPGGFLDSEPFESSDDLSQGCFSSRG